MFDYHTSANWLSFRNIYLSLTNYLVVSFYHLIWRHLGILISTYYIFLSIFMIHPIFFRDHRSRHRHTYCSDIHFFLIQLILSCFFSFIISPISFVLFSTPFPYVGLPLDRLLWALSHPSIVICLLPCIFISLCFKSDFCRYFPKFTNSIKWSRLALSHVVWC